MRTSFTCALCVLGLWVSVPYELAAQEVGSLHHVTGCRNGELEVVTPALWASPERLRVIGRLAGDGPAEEGLECQGAVVRILGTATGRDDARVFEIRSIMNSRRGWILEEHIGREFPKDRCPEMFTEPVHVRRCEA